MKFSSLSLSHSLSLSLRIPGFIKNEYLKLESPSCTLVLSLNALNDINNATTLIVLVQYNKAPSSTDHDLKIVIRNGSTELYISDQAPEATNQTQGMIIFVNFMNVGLNFRRTHGGYGPLKNHLLWRHSLIIIFFTFVLKKCFNLKDFLFYFILSFFF